MTHSRIKNVSCTLEAEIRRISGQGQPGEIVLKTLFQKYPTQKRASKVVQVVKCLLSNPSTAKEKKKKKKRM
jgi:hypothetical protein